MNNHVRLTTVASCMHVPPHWLRTLVYQCVMDDERPLHKKGSPYTMHVPQILQALIARRLRAAAVGYDAIRHAVDGLQIDRRPTHTVPLAPGIKLVLHKHQLIQQARAIYAQAHEAEYPTPVQANAA